MCISTPRDAYYVWVPRLLANSIILTEFKGISIKGSLFAKY